MYFNWKNKEFSGGVTLFDRRFAYLFNFTDRYYSVYTYRTLPPPDDDEWVGFLGLTRGVDEKGKFHKLYVQR